MDLSIVIVNYNVRDLLLNAITSVKSAVGGIATEIIVVDNASSDGAIEALAAEHPDVIAIGLDRNLGFGAANNIGIERARGEYILILNPDTIVAEDTLRAMIAFMREHPKAGVAGCLVLMPDGTPDPAAKRGFPSPWSSFCKVFGLSKLFPRSKIFGGYNLTWIDPQTTTQVDNIQGSFMFYRGDLLRELGGFDTDFFMYGEDLDLCLRTKKAGWEVWYYAGASIIHLRGESTRRSSLDAIAMFYDAMAIFARKHFRSRFLLFLLTIGIAIRRSMARFGRRYPRFDLSLVDIVAVLIGLITATIMKTGALVYPESTLPWVFIAPPIPFLIAIAVAGGYGNDYGRLSRTVLGYFSGFFALSTLPYFFESYRFSRGIVLAMTGIATFVAVGVRFLIFLYERTFGKQSARRVGVISGEPMSMGLRQKVRQLFLGRPTNIIGVIAPSFNALDLLEGEGMGSIENIAQIVRTHDLTDILVVDSSVGYGDVIAAMRNCAGEAVRFHLVKVEGGDLSEELIGSTKLISREPYRRRLPISKRLQDRLLALILLLIRPFLRTGRRSGTPTAGALFEALSGRRPLVGGAATPDGWVDGVFAPSALYSDRLPSRDDRERIEAQYKKDRSLLLDCEIIITSLRYASGTEPTIENDNAITHHTT